MAPLARRFTGIAHVHLVKPAIVTMIELVFSFLILIHTISCLYWHIARYDAPTDLEWPLDSTWKVSNGE